MSKPSNGKVLSKNEKGIPVTVPFNYRHADDPPYDDSGPCIVCPREVRALFDAAAQLYSTSTRFGQVEQRQIDSLGRALVSLQPYMNAHFANHRHSVPADVIKATEEALAQQEEANAGKSDAAKDD